MRRLTLLATIAVTLLLGVGPAVAQEQRERDTLEVEVWVYNDKAVAHYECPAEAEYVRLFVARSGEEFADGELHPVGFDELAPLEPGEARIEYGDSNKEPFPVALGDWQIKIECLAEGRPGDPEKVVAARTATFTVDGDVDRSLDLAFLPFGRPVEQHDCQWWIENGLDVFEPVPSNKDRWTLECDDDDLIVRGVTLRGSKFDHPFVAVVPTPAADRHGKSLVRAATFPIDFADNDCRRSVRRGNDTFAGWQCAAGRLTHPDGRWVSWNAVQFAANAHKVHPDLAARTLTSLTDTDSNPVIPTCASVLFLLDQTSTATTSGECEHGRIAFERDGRPVQLSIAYVAGQAVERDLSFEREFDRAVESTPFAEHFSVCDKATLWLHHEYRGPVVEGWACHHDTSGRERLRFETTDGVQQVDLTQLSVEAAAAGQTVDELLDERLVWTVAPAEVPDSSGSPTALIALIALVGLAAVAWVATRPDNDKEETS